MAFARRVNEQTQMRKGIRKLLVVTVMVVAALAAFAQDAEADTQTNSRVDFTATFALTTVCNFPLTFTSHYTGIRIRLFDDNGVLVKKFFQLTEEDSISANGVIIAQDVGASITPDPGVTGDTTALCTAFSG